MRIADVLPLTPLQQGLLFLADTAQASADVYAVQLNITLSGPLDITTWRAWNLSSRSVVTIHRAKASSQVMSLMAVWKQAAR